MNKIIITILLAITLPACGGGGGSDPAPPVVDVCAPIAHDNFYVNWIGSTNSNFVIDANDELARFRSDNGWLNFKGFDYPAVAVDTGFKIFEDFDGNGVYEYTRTDVTAIISVKGCEIAGAITAPNNPTPNRYIDIIEVSSGLIKVVISNKTPVFAKNVANRYLDDGTGGRQPSIGVNPPQQKPQVIGTATGVAEQ